ncbi:hypothetical protein ARMGADRAFT_485137 [Armillaria gallica]|uniref:F-box domain-containing protein n=1 Tax=Armillaria gallica TaxID=47427 RepID=A0A2H3ECD8_ARMGA|nr:hypothetical protein ARMGADRAFT_485137 [Armillaria gallica]
MLILSPMSLHSELYDQIIDHLANDHLSLRSCSLTSRALLPRSQYHLFKHITLFPPTPHYEARRFPVSKAYLVRSLTIYERRTPSGVRRTDVWARSVLPALLPLFVSLCSVKLSGTMYLDVKDRIRMGVENLLGRMTSLTLDDAYFSSLGELGTFFACLPRLKRLGLGVVTVGGMEGILCDEEGVLCPELEELKVGTRHLRARWMHRLFNAMSLKNLLTLEYPLTTKGDWWMPSVGTMLKMAPTLERAILVDWRGALANIVDVPDLRRLRAVTVFVPLEKTGECEIRNGHTRVDNIIMRVAVLDWIARMLDTGMCLEDVTLVVRGKDTSGDERLREAWRKLTDRPGVTVRVNRAGA